VIAINGLEQKFKIVSNLGEALQAAGGTFDLVLAGTPLLPPPSPRPNPSPVFPSLLPLLPLPYLIRPQSLSPLSLPSPSLTSLLPLSYLIRPHSLYPLSFPSPSLTSLLPPPLSPPSHRSRTLLRGPTKNGGMEHDD
jgi:hypothetical protein